MSKKFFIITGPESSGSAFIAQVIAYYVGATNNINDWSGHGYCKSLKPNIKILHRSQPWCNANQYFTLKQFKEEFKEHPDWYTKATYGDYEFTEKFKKNDNIIIKATGEKAIIDKVEKSKEEDDDTKYYIINNEKYTSEELYKENDKQWDKHKLESETTCYFKSQFYKYDSEKGPTYGIIPTILKTLLDERKATKKRIKIIK